MKKTRSSKLSPEVYRKLIKALSEGLSFRKSAGISNCHFNTAVLLKKKMKAHIEQDIKSFSQTFKIPETLALKIYSEIFREKARPTRNSLFHRPIL